ncbi:MAG TPA: nuclear transport factor 2 family protein [Caulobacteraceae bacterium]|nr:nuclear transport factor 2 family protein [Caulobacteraceae bacterium]
MFKTKLRLALLAAGLAAAPAVAMAADSGPAATVNAFLDAFNRGDIKAAQATNADDVVIIDEVPPHVWRGPGAFQAWLGDLTKDGQANGQTDEKVTMGHLVRSQVDGDTGYAVMTVTFTYRQHSRRTIEPAEIAVALGKRDGAWKITGWAWAGTVPKAVH